MKDSLIEIKNNLQENNSRVNEAKNQINNLEDKEAKNNQWEQEEKKNPKKNKDSISSLWDNFKRPNINIIGLPEGEGEEKEQEIGNLLEKNNERKLSLVKEIDIQVQDAQSPKQDGCKEAPSKTHHN